jgi:iron complex transport system substrate-binding protein
MRIVSLTPNLTELIFALEAGPQVVGVTANDHFPKQVEELPEVGGLQLDYEALLHLRPDLVVFDPALHASHLPQLKKLGLPLKALPTQSLDDLLAAIPELGRQLNREAAAQKLLEQLHRQLEQVDQRRARYSRRPKAVVEIWLDPLSVAGSQSYVGQLMERAGFENAIKQTGYPSLSLEELLRLDPEVLILTQPKAKELAQRPVWKELRAVREGHVLEIAEDLMVRPGPRFVEALQQMQEWRSHHFP